MAPRRSGKKLYSFLVSRALADMVMIGERHAEGIKCCKYDLPVALGNFHFKLGYRRRSTRLDTRARTARIRRPLFRQAN